jgi:mono/diheme cytochrome c family protein
LKTLSKRQRLLIVLCAVISNPLTAQVPESTRAGAGDRSKDQNQNATAVPQGKTLFGQHCSACHTLTQDAIGPPLGGITVLFTESELLERIRDPGKLITTGDARANALLLRYKTVMPPFAHLAPKDLESILAFIDAESASQNLTPLELTMTTSPNAVRRWSPPVQKTGLTVELEDVVQIPRLPGRTPYKGITLLRADPREAGALFIDELMGILYRVKERQVSVFLDLRGTFPGFLCDPGVASGLGSFALHPEFVHNGIFYTIHSETFRGSPTINATDIPANVPKWETPPLEWVLSEWHLTDLKAVSFAGTHREVLRFVTPTTGHAAQEIAFPPVSDPHDPDYGKLYIGIGDGGSGNLKRPDMAGHARTFLGAILRIDPAGRNGTNGQYGIPADNPFAQSEDPTIRKEIWAYGFRNPHRLSWDFTHGRRMISVDIGEANVEEVNLIEKGGAYGWGAASIEGRTRIDVKTDLKVVHPATMEELAGVHLPFGEYDHVEGGAVTGGYVYNGPLEALRGKYIFGDIVNGRLFYMNMGAELTDRTLYELNIVRDGMDTSIKALANATRAHLRIGQDERTGDLFILTKEDGLIRRISRAYHR